MQKNKYFDVAPTYGNAEERLGPALKPFRDRCFLACKTTQRDKGTRFYQNTRRGRKSL